MHRARRIYLLLGFMQGFAWGGWAIAAVIWWTIDLGLSPLQLVLMGTALEGTVLLAETPTGVVADTFSRKWSIVAAWVMVGLASILGPLSGVFGVLLIWQVMWGIGFTLQSGADTAWITDELGTEDDRLILHHALARSVGIIIGVGLSIPIAQWSIRGDMVIFGSCGVALAAYLAIAMPETNFAPKRRGSESRLAEMTGLWKRGLHLVRTRRAPRALVLSAVLMAAADEAIDRLDIARMAELGFPDIEGREAVIWFGLIWIGMTALNIPTMLLAARRVDGLNDRGVSRLLIAMLLISAVAVATIAGPIFAVALVGWALRDIIRETLEPLSVAWINRHAESDVRATVISFHSQAAAAGQVLGGVVLGLIAQLTSLTVAFALAAALVAASALPFFGLAEARGPGRPRPDASEASSVSV